MMSFKQSGYCCGAVSSVSVTDQSHHEFIICARTVDASHVYFTPCLIWDFHISISYAAGMQWEYLFVAQQGLTS